jgi:hypothetical protein
MVLGHRRRDFLEPADDPAQPVAILSPHHEDRAVGGHDDDVDETENRDQSAFR